MKAVLGVLFVLLAIVVMLFASANGGVTPVVPGNGQVYGLHAGHVLFGLQRALAGQVGTTIMTYEGNYLFIWSVPEQGIAFMGVNGSNGQSIKDLAGIVNNAGNLVNLATGNNFIDFLKSRGWTTTTPAEVPIALRIAVTATQAARALTTYMGETVFVMMIAPTPDSAITPEIIKQMLSGGQIQ